MANVSLSTIRRGVERGALRARHVGRQLRIDPQDLNAYLDRESAHEQAEGSAAQRADGARLRTRARARAQTKALVSLDQRVGDLEDEQHRPNQAEVNDAAGLPADLVATETDVWRRLSPTRNRWPEVAGFNQRVAELEMRQAAKADELRELRDRELVAPAADADRLATWQPDGEKGERPQPELPKIRREIRQRQEEWEALTRATERVLAEKAEFVEKHRGRLVKDADRHADEAHRRYLDVIDRLADARA